MEEKSVEQLIEELRALKIREIELITELARVTSDRVETNETNRRDNEQTTVVNGIRRGDRVRITNKVRKPASAGPTWTEAKERLATVTDTTPTQIHILTDNGTRTWRGPNNLRVLHKQG
jgi:CHAT domain-containing protein